MACFLSSAHSPMSCTGNPSLGSTSGPLRTSTSQGPAGQPGAVRLGDRKLVPRPAVEQPPATALVHSTPLLEEERDPGGPTAVADIANPLGVEQPRPRPTLAPDDDPVD